MIDWDFIGTVVILCVGVFVIAHLGERVCDVLSENDQ